MAASKKTTRSKKVKGFSIEEALRFGWKTAAENIEVSLIFAVLFFGLDFFRVGLEFLVKHSGSDHGLKLIGYGLMVLFYWPALLWIQGGMIVVAIRLAQGKEVGAGDLFVPPSIFLRYFVGMFTYLLVMVGGLLLLIVPGVILSLKYLYVPYLMVDRKLPLGETFRVSGEMTDGLKGRLFLFNLTLVGVALLGLLACCIGVFWAMVVMYLAGAYVYWNLLLQTHRSLASKKVA